MATRSNWQARLKARSKSKKVSLTGTARMTGDIWHQDIKIESGAHINGNLKPDSVKSEAKSSARPAVTAAVTVPPVNAGNATGAAAQR